MAVRGQYLVVAETTKLKDELALGSAVFDLNPVSVGHRNCPGTIALRPDQDRARALLSG